MVHIVQIVKAIGRCENCNKPLKKYAVLSDGRLVGLDCASTIISGLPEKITQVEQIIGDIQNRFDGPNRSTTKWVALQVQKKYPYTPIRYTSDTISIWSNTKPPICHAEITRKIDD